MENVLKAKVRIDILAILSGMVEAEFQYLKKSLGLSDGNLSFHLSILEQAKFIKITKTFVGKKLNEQPFRTAAKRFDVVQQYGFDFGYAHFFRAPGCLWLGRSSDARHMGLARRAPLQVSFAFWLPVIPH